MMTIRLFTKKIYDVTWKADGKSQFKSGVCSRTKGKSTSSISGRYGANAKDEFGIKVIAALVFVMGCK